MQNYKYGKLEIWEITNEHKQEQTELCQKQRAKKNVLLLFIFSPLLSTEFRLKKYIRIALVYF